MQVKTYQKTCLSFNKILYPIFVFNNFHIKSVFDPLITLT